MIKFVNRSEEHNIVKIVESGSGSKGTIYEFDYSYCISKGVPTHVLRDSDRVCKSRSILEGKWVSRVASVSDELLVHANLPGKIEGEITFYNPEGKAGFIDGGDGESYFFEDSSVVDDVSAVILMAGKKLRFYPYSRDGTAWAYSVECL